MFFLKNKVKLFKIKNEHEYEYECEHARSHEL